MKRFILIVLLIMALAIPSFCMAADTARAIAVGGQVESVVAIADGSSGYSVEVDSSGNLATRSGTSTVISSTGVTLNTGVALITGSKNIQAIEISGPLTSAGDYVLLYDALTATGTPVFELSVGTAKDTRGINCFGAKVTTGLFADSNDNDVFVSVVYN